MEPTDIKDEILEETIQAMKQLIAKTERQLTDGCNTACKEMSDAKAVKRGRSNQA